MSKVLVIGYGNTLRGDDAVGVRAAELIASRNWQSKFPNTTLYFLWMRIQALQKRQRG